MQIRYELQAFLSRWNIGNSRRTGKPLQKAILWDNDGILVNSEVLFYEATRRYLQRHEIELNPDLYFEYFLCNSAGTWHLLRDKGLNDDQITTARHERNELYTELLDSAPDLTTPGIETVLQQFSEKCHMAIVTSSDRGHFEQIHQRTGLLSHFNLVVAAGDYRHEKPNPEPYLVAANRLGVSPVDCIAVEDSPRGLNAANAAGIPCVVMRTHLTARHSFTGAYAVVDNPAELQFVLHEWYEKHDIA